MTKEEIQSKREVILAELLSTPYLKDIPYKLIQSEEVPYTPLMRNFLHTFEFCRHRYIEESNFDELVGYDFDNDKFLFLLRHNFGIRVDHDADWTLESMKELMLRIEAETKPEYREMLSNVVSATTKITKAEASTLVAGYEAKKSDAETMVALSKDFINGALRTGRKVNLGATEKSNISIQLKEIPESEKKFPMKTGVNDDGTPRYEKAQTIIPAHEGLKVSSPCPTWTTVDNKKKK